MLQGDIMHVELMKGGSLRLSRESTELLFELAERFDLPEREVIERALMQFARNGDTKPDPDLEEDVQSLHMQKV